MSKFSMGASVDTYVDAYVQNLEDKKLMSMQWAEEWSTRCKNPSIPSEVRNP